MEEYRNTFLSDNYLISNLGNVYSLKTNRVLKPSKNPRGYLIVNIRVDGKIKGVAVHTLVARAFCKGYKDGLQVNHKDGNKINNTADNLEWVTPSQNVIHSVEVLGEHTGKNNGNALPIILTDVITKQVYTFDSLMDAANYLKPEGDKRQLRRVQQSIWRVLRGYRRTYAGYSIKYKD